MQILYFMVHFLQKKEKSEPIYLQIFSILLFVPFFSQK